jgi:hypothetical protein
MEAAGDAGVEGVDYPQDFQRVGRIGHGNAYEGLRTLIDQGSGDSQALIFKGNGWLAICRKAKP